MAEFECPGMWRTVDVVAGNITIHAQGRPSHVNPDKPCLLKSETDSLSGSQNNRMRKSYGHCERCGMFFKYTITDLNKKTE